ncbi:MAG: hypothetical protein ABI073_04105 [Luteolibacter sp.]
MRAILEVDQFASYRESLAGERGLPLIPPDSLGIHCDDDGMLTSDFLIALPSGAEAIPFLDEEQKVVYKLFDLRAGVMLGKKISLEETESDRFEVKLLPADLADTLEKLAVLNEAGGHPTEIVGLSSNGDYLIAKQPLAFPYHDYQTDRDAATEAMGGIVPPFTNLARQVAVIWLDSRAWLICDLNQHNIMRNREGNATVIDGLIGPIPPDACRKLAWLREAVEDAEAMRFEMSGRR